ncbi:hypothetical protein N0V83_010997 [Neocucurbitaria cava]|uniref:Calcineurin-like phosphoesterase domain-containing protein n=1 Tax=Neocucurbitaria cava TaxID=798079 RepID=A0A9W9CHA3_9PLEO|nr:hypothetical protein N0V83_010997 [Neocucurbitaria cava]
MTSPALHSSPNSRHRSPWQKRKTRIVCISDTHNQTPKLPPGDVLIHAGDLTNQGSYDELKRAVEWLEKQSGFEVKIVVAGNHDITLDPPFYHSHGAQNWKWPTPQDPTTCRELFRSSASITYLENETATIKLASPTGPQTCFTVFGSPCTPRQQQGNWAFQYDEHEAEDVWSKLGDGVDVVVTHTPPKGLCDSTSGMGDQSGCPALLRRLGEVRPALSVCGHIHAGRGVEKVRWRTSTTADNNENEPGSLVDSVEYWTDLGKGNKKLSLVDLTSTTRRPFGDAGGGLTRQHGGSHSLEHDIGGQQQPDAAPSLLLQQQDEGPLQPRSGDEKLISTPSLSSVALQHSSEALLRGRSEGGNALEAQSDIGHDKATAQPQIGGCQRKGLAGIVERNETVVINAAHLGPRVAGKASGFNKPIVVDVELPVWSSES